ncbi:SusC/RagA family TonB-linked outer membrane protein [Galbibacter pacificus]|uniref:SusC/RagA family TonB-linked outer membrane protein n=1 Tax=Galbibacter pacificus TaxID=2996052 RepID=A0ABT6FS07_9FLAO|nr:SusC/RagA family TonB-linked outer membrane protein [Galbibacter pacificus]MDG3581692.1 SusC/RagA family TonB-linked outer membrane protein [Galbibacter pacificus]MDG3585834.1 SusC/RagA family TonB-linked outer membrane protein [Galbibacter pacificus]
MSLLLLYSFAFSQNISGTVTDVQGTPLPGVSIMIEGTSNGTTTDFDGKYTIEASTSAVLTYTYLGMKTQTRQVGSNTTIDVTLQEDATSLDEVVVSVALGETAKKKSLANAVQAVSSEQLLEGNQNNMVNGLQGKVSGVTIASSGGVPGSSSVILIRGGNSITGNNQPLFVVDGIPIDNSTNSSLEVASTNRASDINPEDIEDISILKGPTAAALYGIQASNGAVIITTKKGKAGISKISYSGSLSVDKILGTPDVQTTYGQGEQDTEGDINPSSSFSWGEQISPGTPIYKNIDDFYKTAITQNHNVSYSTGNEKSNIYFSIGDVSQDGIIPSTSYDKTSFKINANSKFSKNLSIGISGNYINTKISSTKQGNATGGSFNSLLAYPVTVDAKDYLNPNGSQKAFYGGQEFDNPYWSIANSPNTDDVKRLIGVINLNYNFLNDFNLTYRVGTDDYNEFNKKVTGDGSLVDNREDGYISQFEKDYSRFTSTLMLRYNKEITEDFTLDAMAGNSVEELDIRTTTTTGDGFQAPGIYSIANVAMEDQSISELIQRKRIVGFFGELKLGWRDALFITATGRNDWTSTLPKDKRSFFYPSVGASAVLTDLFDISSDSGLNYLKIRGTWAKVGKDAPIGALESSLGKNLNGAASSAYAWNGVNVGNPNLEPEFTDSYEVGAEVRFLNNRISLDMSYYYSLSDNQILKDIRVPPTTGTFYATLNGGSIKNQGIEALLSAQILRPKNDGLFWSMDFNFGMNESTVEDLPGFLNEVYLSDSWTFRNSAAGAAILDGSLFGLRGKQPERDANGNMIIDTRDLPVLSDQTYTNVNRMPDWTLGITNNLSYKNMSLSFLFDIVQGQDIYNATESAMIYYGQSVNTLDRGQNITLTGVDADGNPKEVTRVKDQAYYTDYYSLNSQNFIEDGSFARLRYVTLSYKFPQQILDKLSLSALELYATGRNLLTITDYSGVDPEVNTFGAGISGAGSTYIDNLGTPNTKGFDLGLKFTF